MRILTLAIVLFVSEAALSAQDKRTPIHDYSAAVVSGSSLHIFPFNGGERSIELPVSPNFVVPSLTNAVIYALITTAPKVQRLVRIDLLTRSVLELAGQEGFTGVMSFAIDSKEKDVLISGTYSIGGKRSGLFSLDLETGIVRNVASNMSDAYLSSWTSLSLAPDGDKAVATAKKGRVAFVNVKELRLERFWDATAAFFSPSGRWILSAGFEPGLPLTLIDASNFSKKSALGDAGSSIPVWSPDSRYILLWKSALSCGLAAGYTGTLEELDVETGAKKDIESSRCRVNHPAFWVSNEVLSVAK
jgi:hypothetical protein